MTIIENEMFRSRDHRGATVEQFKKTLADYIGWYNGERIKRSPGGRSPDQYRRSMGLIA
jgi:hypothetical protein